MALINWTLDGNILIRHRYIDGGDLQIVYVEDGVVDLSRVYEKYREPIAESAEKRGIEVVGREPEKETDDGFIRRLCIRMKREWREVVYPQRKR